jgi:hypothetical protein
MLSKPVSEKANLDKRDSPYNRRVLGAGSKYFRAPSNLRNFHDETVPA